MKSIDYNYQIMFLTNFQCILLIYLWPRIDNIKEQDFIN